ncbi:cupin domain-containing protein [Streptomyces sp. NBC_00289]|uniref:hypothetical protein n=1 Tax=Streptomyces sp. NBC_00289 TaxID=2975703 RepID=UPI00324ED2BA
MGDPGEAPTEPAADLVLHPGDVLYVPATASSSRSARTSVSCLTRCSSSSSSSARRTVIRSSSSGSSMQRSVEGRRTTASKNRTIESLPRRGGTAVMPPGGCRGARRHGC